MLEGVSCGHKFGGVETRGGHRISYESKLIAQPIKPSRLEAVGQPSVIQQLNLFMPKCLTIQFIAVTIDSDPPEKDGR